jgi:thiol-disulfide isomerase/thioredoxin
MVKLVYKKDIKQPKGPCVVVIHANWCGHCKTLMPKFENEIVESDDFNHYKYFIYITKQHSAVHVIFHEFSQQIKLGNLPYLKIESEPIMVNKKYIIKYLNLKTNNICQIIIGTVDSLMYALGNKNHKEFDRFEGLVNSIIDDHIETVTTCGTINYSSLKPKLSKETILIGDEEQDLKISYAKAIIQIMRNRYIDVYIVGDKLQSISNEKNAFTYFLENEFPLINTIKLEITN